MERTQNSPNNFEKNEIELLTFSDLKTCYKATINFPGG